MLFVPLHLLKPGMILAENIPSNNIRVPLLMSGQPLTNKVIVSLEERGIPGTYIDSSYAEGIEPKVFFPPETRSALLSGIKSEYDRVRFSTSAPNIQILEDMAVEVVMAALQQENLLYNVITIRNYDDYTYSHSLYVGGIASLIGAHLKLPHKQLTALATAGLLHDIGKLDIAYDIVNKPASLTDTEFSQMKAHPQLGVQRLKSKSCYLSYVLEGVESHHEYYDGNGYPYGLSGDDIPLFGRILALADVYDALSSNRSYRMAWSPSKIIDYISSRGGTQFDPEILPAFLHSVAAYPVGTLVSLSNGWTAVVTRNHPAFILRPTIRILAPAEEAGREIDLSCSMLNVTVTDLANQQIDLNL